LEEQELLELTRESTEVTASTLAARRIRKFFSLEEQELLELTTESTEVTDAF